MSVARRILRYLRSAVLVVLALAIVALGYLTLTPPGRATLAARISAMASSDDLGIRISGIDGIWSGNLGIRQVIVEDGEGPWLALRDVRVDWSPLALLGFTFSADSVSARRIELARLPESGSSEGGGAGLPVELDIRSFDFPEIALGEALAGGVAQVGASGSLQVEGAPLAAEGVLALSRTDGADGQVSARIAYVPEDNRLDIEADGSEAANGVIANLLRLPGRPAVSFDASGNGPLSNWSGQAAFSVAGEVVTRLSARHQITDRGSLVRLEGDGQFAPFAPQAYAGLVAGRSSFDLAGTRLENGGYEVEGASLGSDAVTLEARGTVDPDGLSDFNLTAQARDGSVPLGIGEGASAVDIAIRQASLRLFGPGDALAVNGEVELAEIATPQFVLEDATVGVASDAFDIASRSGTLDLTVRAGAAGAANATLAGLLAGEVRLGSRIAVSGDRVSFSDSRLDTGTANATFSGELDMTTLALGADLSGQVLATVLPQAARAPLGERVAFSARLERGPDGAIRATGLDARSGALAVEGEAMLSGETVSATLAGAISDVSRLSGQATGQAAFTLAAAGNLAQPTVEFGLSSERMVVAGRAVEDLSLTGQARANPAAPTGSFRLAGSVGGEELAGRGTLAASAGGSRIDDLEITLGQNRVEGVLAVGAQLLPEGEVSFSLPELGPLGALALLDIEGSARGTARFSAAGEAPGVTLDATVDTFRQGEIEAGEIRVSATAVDYLAAPRVAGAVSAGRIVSGGAEVREVSVSLTQQGEWTAFDAKAIANAIPLAAEGRVGFAGGRVTVELDEASASMRNITARLATPTRVTAAGGTVSLDGLTIEAAGGTARISGTAGDQLDLSVGLQALPASAANTFVPGLDARGTVSGTAQITGTADDPRVAFDARLAGLQLAQTRAAGFGTTDIEIDGTFAGGMVRFQTRVQEGSGIGLNGGGSINVNARTIDASFNGRVPFGFLGARLAAQGLALDGAADVSLSAQGSLFSPTLGGTITTGSARLVHAPSGIAVNDLAARITLASGTATIAALNGTLSTGGALSGSGTVGIMPSSGFPADLTLNVQDGRYTDGSVVTSNFGGRIAVTGSLTGEPTLAGEINLGRTVITVPERLPGSLASLQVQHRNAPAAVARQDAALNPGGSASGGSGVRLDLQVNAPQQIFIQGRGLDVELGGSLRLTGPAASPQATGRFTMRRGRLSILGQRLEFTRGNVGFSGSLVPYLDLAADSRVNDATVTVVVTGPANNPAFAFESSPALPEDEILARLVFGRAMGELSPVQIAQLAAAAGQLAGIGGSTGLLESLRERTGLDDIDVRTDEETGDTSLSVGKYLNDRTYVTIEKGSQPGSGKATIDLDIGGGVKLRGEATDGGDTRGGIFYEREY